MNERQQVDSKVMAHIGIVSPIKKKCNVAQTLNSSAVKTDYFSSYILISAESTYEIIFTLYFCHNKPIIRLKIAEGFSLVMVML